jgi:hypothetical protein
MQSIGMYRVIFDPFVAENSNFDIIININYTTDAHLEI